MRLWEFAVRRWQFTLLVFALLVALGASAWRNIPRSEDPIFPIPIVSVVAVYPGADPADVERLIVDPIEDAINALDDVAKIDSESGDGLAIAARGVQLGHGSRQEVRRGRARDQRAARDAAGRARARSRCARSPPGSSTSCSSRS